MKTFLHRIVRSLHLLNEKLLQPHPIEVRQGTIFQEEARSERLANVVRFCFVLGWTAVASVWAFFNTPLYTVINLSVGSTWMVLTVIYHAWLMHQAYTSSRKFVSTAVDMAFTMLLMVCYALAEGPSFVFKMPIFINFFYVLAFAALRFHRNLVLYATALAVGSLGLLWLWLQFVVGIEYGSRLEHTYTGKLNFFYMTDILLYTGMFGFLTVMIVKNQRRQIELRVTGAESAARDQERVLMAAGLAHEIKNPLSGIYGAAQLLRDEGISDPRYTGVILSEARRLNRVVEEFLCFARPFPVSSGPVDLVAVVSAFCREESRLRPEPPVVCFAEHEIMEIQTDANAVRQVLLNLLQNARRYQRRGLPVRVGLDTNGIEVRVRVEDDGPGVPDEMETRLFDPFKTSAGGNTGLGLSLSRKIARELGGDLVYRPLAPGAQFTLVLPASPRLGHE